MCKHEVEVIVISLELDVIRAYEHIKLYYVYISINQSINIIIKVHHAHWH